MAAPLLFTPGPLTTHERVRAALGTDYGSRDTAFIELVREVRHELLALAGVSAATGWTCVLMQGSGSFGIEATLGSALPRAGKLLVVVNGAYGRRMVQMARVLGIEVVALTCPEATPPRPQALAEQLATDPAITHVAMVHCETTTGIFNPYMELGRVAKAAGKTVILDAMSSFGGVAIALKDSPVDFLVSSSNKCIEGVPGFSFVLARQAALAACNGNARSLALDLHAQWTGLEQNGQFRFTPPTHALAGFREALRLLEEEGGIPAREKRYKLNAAILKDGMARRGFELYLAPEHAGHIISTFVAPEHPHWDFQRFYDGLLARGFAIYPGKLTERDAFRIGHIGQLFARDMEALLNAIDAVLMEMGVVLARAN